MSAQIDIGRDTGGQRIAIDLEELLATRLLVQGNSGSGKSHLLRRLLEECAGQVQQVIIDPEGDFVTLADAFGHVVIDGAAYSPREIEELAARVRQHRASVVLALDELEVEQQIRCAALFLTALFDAPREHWYPALVVVDEAQMFAPAAAGEMTDDTRRLTLSAMTNLMCRGRKRGLAGIVATQRLAKLAKNVAAEASNFLMGRTFLDIDMQRAADLLGMDRRQAERIRDLQRGQFLGLGPAISRRPVAVNVGSVRTGSRGGGKGLLPLPEADGDAMEALLTDRLAEAASDPAPRRAAPPPPRPKLDIEHELAAPRPLPAPMPQRAPDEDTASANDTAPAAPPKPTPPSQTEPIESHSAESVVREIADSEGATFRPATSLFRDFAIRCRQRGVASAHIDITRFRRLFAYRVGGLDRLEGTSRAYVEQLVESVEDDVLAPYLAMVIAATLGEAMPEDDELARLYGSSSPSRVRRLLDHLERQGLIVVREDFGGDREIIVPGAEALAASNPAE
ncbi:ATP-binding protein [Porphyrobacter sp. AAP60]|uniref:ATP-binding protein n=1 Tax=Porphyrobacter sp. AAP60 TaxID=1523423 RepID=UPI0006B96551|nr:ATP-binding protein [Porphyrobacter sp. AAP60]KPF64964.1 ATP-binding protein [Porphyrobacter sp. AAP60]